MMIDSGKWKRIWLDLDSRCLGGLVWLGCFGWVVSVGLFGVEKTGLSRNSEGRTRDGARRMRIRATIGEKSDAGLLVVSACKTVVM